MGDEKRIATSQTRVEVGRDGKPISPDPIARIEGALSRLGEEHEPPAGWEDRVHNVALVRARTRRRAKIVAVVVGAVVGVILALALG